MVRVGDENTATMSMTLFWCLCCFLSTCFTLPPSVSVFDFGHVGVSRTLFVVNTLFYIFIVVLVFVNLEPQVDYIYEQHITKRIVRKLGIYLFIYYFYLFTANHFETVVPLSFLMQFSYFQLIYLLSKSVRSLHF